MWEWIPAGWGNAIGIMAGGILAIVFATLFAHFVALWAGRGWFRAKREHNHEVYKWRDLNDEHDYDNQFTDDKHEH